MSIHARSWSASSESRVVYAALAALFVSLTLLHFGFYHRHVIRDTVEYHRYGLAVFHGEVPYRDFRVEYPPGALPLLVLPAIGSPGIGGYQAIFQGALTLCAVGALLAMAAALRSLRASPERVTGALGFFALAPLVLGSVVIYRYDLWPAALTVAGLSAIIARRQRLGFAALGLGIAAKLFPGVLIPPALAYVWRSRGRREAGLCLLSAAASVLVLVVPFLVLAPHGLWASIERQAHRPLQIESLGSGILLAAHQISGLHLRMITSQGSQNLSGSLPDALGIAQSAVLAFALLGIWTAAALGPARPERLVRYAVASVTAFVAFDKVLSPQFMIWLIPLVPLVRGRRGLAASGLLAVALLLTQLWFPLRYWALVLHFAAFPSWLVLARGLVLVCLLLVLLVREREPVPVRS
ncbi:MAG: glycosyltransferase 87 family protein [Gaiellaceae bacterium]